MSPAGPRETPEPGDPLAFTRELDRSYTAWSHAYDLAVRWGPVWKTWIGRALAHVEGPRVLEVSFGTGWLLTRYPADAELHGIDYNGAMARTARANLERVGRSARLAQADVAHLPYPDAAFDTLVCTMAFTGYPDGRAALAEMKRVLRPGGRLVIVDFAHPPQGRRLGRWLAGLMERAGDILRDMGPLFDTCGMDWTEREIGGFGSVRLWVATRRA